MVSGRPAAPAPAALPATKSEIDVTPDGPAFAGAHENKTKAQVKAGFAAFVEGTKP